MKAALDNFDKIDAKNKLVILGDMFELGETSAEEHQNIATTAIQNKTNQCIFVGPQFSQSEAARTQKSFLGVLDCMQYLKTLPANKYDLVVMDPPTFSNSKRMKNVLDIQKDHVELINDVLRAMKPGGILYFSTNFSQFKLESESIHTKLIKDITKATTPFDFDGRLKRACFKLQKPV
jgi:23S rRNA (cytosine1962-C5)-methyltransferase